MQFCWAPYERECACSWKRKNISQPSGDQRESSKATSAWSTAGAVGQLVRGNRRVAVQLPMDACSSIDDRTEQLPEWKHSYICFHSAWRKKIRSGLAAPLTCPTIILPTVLIRSMEDMMFAGFCSLSQQVIAILTTHFNKQIQNGIHFTKTTSFSINHESKCAFFPHLP